jgi:hypothetical protein
MVSVLRLACARAEDVQRYCHQLQDADEGSGGGDVDTASRLVAAPNEYLSVPPLGVVSEMQTWRAVKGVMQRHLGGYCAGSATGSRSSEGNGHGKKRKQQERQQEEEAAEVEEEEEEEEEEEDGTGEIAMLNMRTAKAFASAERSICEWCAELCEDLLKRLVVLGMGGVGPSDISISSVSRAVELCYLPLEKATAQLAARSQLAQAGLAGRFAHSTRGPTPI